jgi:hypothetical protein
MATLCKPLVFFDSLKSGADGKYIYSILRGQVP